MRLLLFALLPWAGIAASSPEAKPDAASACQDKGCSTSGLSLLQKKSPRVGRSAEPVEEEEEEIAIEAGSSAELIQEKAEEEAAHKAEALYERQVRALFQRVKDGRQFPHQDPWGGAGNCPICQAAGPDAVFDGAAEAGPVWISTDDQEQWDCSKAQNYVNEASHTWNACPLFPSAWTDHCCKNAMVVRTAGAGSNPECKELCPGDRVINSNWAGKYSTGKYWHCSRAARVLGRLQEQADQLPTNGPPTCVRQRPRWRETCCANLQPACNMCQRGKLALKGALQVEFNGQSVTCKAIFDRLQQEDSNGCLTGKNKYASACCQSQT